MKGICRVVVGVSLLASAGGCSNGSDGGNDSGFNRGLCEIAKIAGGKSCSPPPRSIAIVVVNGGYCSGTFITTRHVLTAGHCFRGGTGRVEIGALGFQSSASNVAVHPNYDGAIDSPFDVAVVTLKDAAAVTPVALMASRDVASGDTVVTYGFGLDEDGNSIVERVQKGEAALKVTTLAVSNVSQGTVETISDGSGDTCQGDSGAALLLADSTGEPGIVGLVRSGPNICETDSGLPGGNTNVQNPAVVDFILKTAPATQTR